MATKTTDETAVVDAALDYFEGWFAGDVSRMERALHPGFAKRALYEGGTLNEDTAASMIEATAQALGKRDGVEIDVEAAEIYGDIATAIVRSTVYREYLHLARTRDGWKIVNALWQKT